MIILLHGVNSNYIFLFINVENFLKIIKTTSNKILKYLFFHFGILQGRYKKTKKQCLVSRTFLRDVF